MNTQKRQVPMIGAKFVLAERLFYNFASQKEDRFAHWRNYFLESEAQCSTARLMSRICVLAVKFIDCCK